MIIVTRNVELIRAAGLGFISSGAGVTADGSPVRRWVHLMQSGDPIESLSTQKRAYSRAGGGFRFDNLPLANTYLLIARDESPRTYNDVIASGIQPVAYP